MKILVVLVMGLLMSFSAFCWLGPKDDSIYGPFRCDACMLQSPIADEPTRAFIARWLRATQVVTRNSFFGLAVGARIQICNSTVCATYQRTDSGDWQGIKREPIIPRPTPRRTPDPTRSPEGVTGPDPTRRGGIAGGGACCSGGIGRSGGMGMVRVGNPRMYDKH